LTEVRNTIDSMSNNKAGDCYGLRIEHFKLAGDLYYSLLAMCFNTVLVHGIFLLRQLRLLFVPVLRKKMASSQMYLIIDQMH